jgi:hypothetical protein
VVFNHNRYMTRRIAYELPQDLVMFMWMRIDELRAQSDGRMDYLQVFELKPMVDDLGQTKQVTIHRSEQPAYEQRYELSMVNPEEAKVSVIDSGDYSTMLFGEEY